RGGKPEGALLQPAIPQGEPVAGPVADLQPVAAPIAEDEQMSAERVLFEYALDEVRQAVEPLPHVGRLPCRQDADRRGQAPHRRASSIERTASSVGGSKPRVTRPVGPPGSAISIGHRSGTGPGSSGTTCTGTKAEWRANPVEGLVA